MANIPDYFMDTYVLKPYPDWRLTSSHIDVDPIPLQHLEGTRTQRPYDKATYGNAPVTEEMLTGSVPDTWIPDQFPQPASSRRYPCL